MPSMKSCMFTSSGLICASARDVGRAWVGCDGKKTHVREKSPKMLRATNIYFIVFTQGMISQLKPNKVTTIREFQTSPYLVADCSEWNASVPQGRYRGDSKNWKLLSTSSNRESLGFPEFDEFWFLLRSAPLLCLFLPLILIILTLCR